MIDDGVRKYGGKYMKMKTFIGCQFREYIHWMNKVCRRLGGGGGTYPKSWQALPMHTNPTIFQILFGWPPLYPTPPGYICIVRVSQGRSIKRGFLQQIFFFKIYISKSKLKCDISTIQAPIDRAQIQNKLTKTVFILWNRNL